MLPYVAYNNVFHNFAKECLWDGSVVSRVWFKAFLVDWGNQCLKPVVGEFACVVWLLEDVRDDGGNLFCSFLEDSSWEFVWASSFILLLHAICSPFKTFSNGSETDIAIRVYSMSTRMRQPSASGSTEPELVTELASLSGSGCCLPEVGRFVYDKIV